MKRRRSRKHPRSTTRRRRSRTARRVRPRRSSHRRRRAAQFRPGDRVRVNDTPWSAEPGRAAQMVGLTGTVLSGPSNTRAGTYYDVELDASDDEIAANSLLSVGEVARQDGVFQFEPEQLDPA